MPRPRGPGLHGAAGRLINSCAHTLCSAFAGKIIIAILPIGAIRSAVAGRTFPRCGKTCGLPVSGGQTGAFRNDPATHEIGDRIIRHNTRHSEQSNVGFNKGSLPRRDWPMGLRAATPAGPSASRLPPVGRWVRGRPGAESAAMDFWPWLNRWTMSVRWPEEPPMRR